MPPALNVVIANTGAFGPLDLLALTQGVGGLDMSDWLDLDFNTLLRRVQSLPDATLPRIFRTLDKAFPRLADTHPANWELGALQAVVLLGKILEAPDGNTLVCAYWGDAMNPRVAAWTTSLVSRVLAHLATHRNQRIRVIATTHRGAVLNGLRLPGVTDDGRLWALGADERIDYLWAAPTGGEGNALSFVPIAVPGKLVNGTFLTDGLPEILDDLFYEGRLGVGGTHYPTR